MLNVATDVYILFFFSNSPQTLKMILQLTTAGNMGRYLNRILFSLQFSIGKKKYMRLILLCRRMVSKRGCNGFSEIQIHKQAICK